jgi:hypothetical protein
LTSVRTIVFAESNNGIFVLSGRIKPEKTRSKKAIVTTIQIQTWKFIQKHDVCKRFENSQPRSILNQSDRFDRFQARKAGRRKTKEIVDSVVDSNNSQILLRSIRESTNTPTVYGVSVSQKCRKKAWKIVSHDKL